MFQSMVLRKILSVVTRKLKPMVKVSGTIGMTIFIVIVTIASMLLLPEEDVLKTWFPLMESMWSNIPH